MYVSRRSEGHPGGPCRGIGPQVHPPGGGVGRAGGRAGPLVGVVRGETVTLCLYYLGLPNLRGLCLALPCLPCLARAVPCRGCVALAGRV